MTAKLFAGLGVCQDTINVGKKKRMLTYAKTECGKDWQYAYHFMLTHNGQGPKMGVTL